MSASKITEKSEYSVYDLAKAIKKMISNRFSIDEFLQAMGLLDSLKIQGLITSKNLGVNRHPYSDDYRNTHWINFADDIFRMLMGIMFSGKIAQDEKGNSFKAAAKFLELYSRCREIEVKVV